MILSQIDTTQGMQHPQGEHVFMLHCWQCNAELTEMTTVVASSFHRCLNCAAVTECRDGIWLALSPSRLTHFETFMTEYAGIRAAEGRGSVSAEYYLSLPYRDVSGCNSDQWHIRARTFDALTRQIVAPFADELRRPLRVLDLGSGNGWMSYRLAFAGHLPVAVDLSTNARDGLGATTHYVSHISHMFPCVQAELDQLPFATSSFDLAIFNASFHYSENYERTLAEAVRCVTSSGSVVIADTPWYANEESGRRMVAEKHKRFANAYGFPSNSIASLEFLTPERLCSLGERFGLEWRCIRPNYGLRWALRPFVAKLKRRRTPSQFRIFETMVKA